MKNVIGAAVVLGTAMVSGCSSVDAFNKVSNVYGAARSGMAVKSTFKIS